MNVFQVLVLLVNLFVLYKTIWKFCPKGNWEPKKTLLRFWNILYDVLLPQKFNGR